MDNLICLWDDLRRSNPLELSQEKLQDDLFCSVLITRVYNDVHTAEIHAVKVGVAVGC